MTADPTPSGTRDHAEQFGATSRALMAAALEFARGVQPTFTVDEVAKMYLGVGAWLAAAAVGNDAAVAMLRDLADRIEAGEQKAN